MKQIKVEKGDERDLKMYQAKSAENHVQDGWGGGGGGGESKSKLIRMSRNRFWF